MTIFVKTVLGTISGLERSLQENAHLENHSFSNLDARRTFPIDLSGKSLSAKPGPPQYIGAKPEAEKPTTKRK